jgi:metal-responsive CopG/Arc/MetJ family transcriptional regulator
MAYKPVTFSADRELIDRIDARAKSLGMNRSEYLAQLVRADLINPSAPLQIVAEMPTPYPATKRKQK